LEKLRSIASGGVRASDRPARSLFTILTTISWLNEEIYLPKLVATKNKCSGEYLLYWTRTGSELMRYVFLESDAKEQSVENLEQS
jgi:hypothetical protein